MSRRKLQADSRPLGKDVVTTVRKELSRTLTHAKMQKLHDLCNELLVMKRFLNHSYNNIAGLAHLNDFHKTIRDVFVQEGLPEQIKHTKLQARQWKTVLSEVFANISSRYELTVKAVLKNLWKNINLTANEKHYAALLLKNPALISTICLKQKQKTAAVTSKLEITPAEKIRAQQWIRRQFRAQFCQNRKATINKITNFTCDSSMFTFYKGNAGQSYLSVMGLEKSKRMIIPLTNTQLMPADFKGGDIRVVLKPLKNQVAIHRAIHTVVNAPKAEAAIDITIDKVVAVNMGFTTTFSCSEGTEYGEGFGKILQEHSDRLSWQHNIRRHFNAQVRSHQAKKQATVCPTQRAKIQLKIDNIIKNNLGKQKYYRKKAASHLRIITHINTAFNQLMNTEKPAAIVVPQLNAPKSQMYLTSWINRKILQKIKLSCQMNSVRFVEVNPAYSSQVCPGCRSLSTKRAGSKLHCCSCDKDWNANISAGIALKHRFGDEEIRLYTPCRQVKEILLQRFKTSVETVQPRPERGLLQLPPGANYQKRV